MTAADTHVLVRWRRNLRNISVREFINVSPGTRSWNSTLLGRVLFSAYTLLPPVLLPGTFFTRAICINIHRALNRLNEYTGWRKAGVTSPAGFSAVNFNRENMLTLPPPLSLFLYTRSRRARVHSQARIIRRNEQTRSETLPPSVVETTRHNARLWLEVGTLLSTSYLLLSPCPISFTVAAVSAEPAPLRPSPSFYSVTLHDLGSST